MESRYQRPPALLGAGGGGIPILLPVQSGVGAAAPMATIRTRRCGGECREVETFPSFPSVCVR